ncbi:MAG: low molecular weight phosphatase family protein [Verrucomicrobiales bacterium]|jgi:arsenate reductase|nr:low molecular weight phosphatase family protein [Verrucomicrobiales bacterium]MDP6677438.1 arsenate reductase ArsC [Verrucomicrobiota bacterium]MDP6753311.1 arsenate reductase ArsC [Verrucomicrobiota bacterium]
METKAKPTVLILCTGNSCRSHMAEGVLREVAGDLLDVQSAGSDPAGFVHPLAIRALAEIGIDISAHASKHLNEFLNREVETVITVCDDADRACPVFPGQVNRHHWPFPDPAKATGSKAEIWKTFEQVRDDIRRKFTDYGQARKEAGQALGKIIDEGDDRH